MNKVFIQANNKQLLGALIAKFAINKNSPNLDVDIINVDEISLFKNFSETPYLFNDNEIRISKKEDLQFFTLSRFMPPELMKFEGRAIVIDPDIFALSDINELLNMNMNGNSILACRKKNAWDTSVMLLDCTKLKHWKISELLKNLKEKKSTYTKIITLQEEKNVGELDRKWNSLDELNQNTKMLHTTNRLTQPWKTGLTIDFTRNKMPKIFGLIPREPIHKLLGKYKMKYEPHPNKEIERLFFKLSKEALASGEIEESRINMDIKNGNIRPDFIKRMRELI